jgi:colanic acid biosynthesis glycosyl transferase WcaI
MMADADCCAITQQPGTGELFFPSKLLTTLALAKPVLSIADDESDLALAVIEGLFGLNAPPGHPQEVVATLRQLARPETDLKALGEKGRLYVARYEQQYVLGNFEEELNRLVSRPGTSDLGSAGPSKPVAESEASVK